MNESNKVAHKGPLMHDVSIKSTFWTPPLRRHLIYVPLSIVVVDSNGNRIKIPPPIVQPAATSFGQVLSFDDLKSEFFGPPYKRVAFWLGHINPYEDDAALQAAMKQQILSHVTKLYEETVHIGLMRNRGVGLIKDVLDKLRSGKSPQVKDSIALGGISPVAQLDLDRFDKVDWDWWAGQDFSVFYDPMTSNDYAAKPPKTFVGDLVAAGAQQGLDVYVIAFEGGHFTTADLKAATAHALTFKPRVKLVLHTGWWKAAKAQDGQLAAASKVCRETQQALKDISGAFEVVQRAAATDVTSKKSGKKHKDLPHECPTSGGYTMAEYNLVDIRTAHCQACFDGGNARGKSKHLIQGILGQRMTKETFELITEKLDRIWKYPDFINFFYKSNARKFEKVVQWTGFSDEYSESLLLYKAIEDKVVSSGFDKNTIHITPTTWMGVGAVSHVLGRMRREGRLQNVAVGGICASTATDYIDAPVYGMFAWAKQDFAMFFPPLTPGGWNLAYNFVNYTSENGLEHMGDTATADVIVHAAAYGLQAHNIAFEGGKQSMEEALNVIERVKRIALNADSLDDSKLPEDKKMAAKDREIFKTLEQRKGIRDRVHVHVHLGWQKLNPDTTKQSFVKPLVGLLDKKDQTQTTADEYRDRLIKSTVCKADCKVLECYSAKQCQCDQNKHQTLLSNAYATALHSSAMFPVNATDSVLGRNGDNVKYCLSQIAEDRAPRFEAFDLISNEQKRKKLGLTWTDYELQSNAKTDATEATTSTGNAPPVTPTSSSKGILTAKRQADTPVAADIMVAGTSEGSKSAPLRHDVELCLQLSQKQLRLEKESKDVPKHKEVKVCKIDTKAQLNAGKQIISCTTGKLAEAQPEVKAVAAQLKQAAHELPDETLTAALCVDPVLLPLSLAALVAKLVQRLCMDCEIDQQGVPTEIALKLGGLDSAGKPLLLIPQKAAEIIEKVTEILTYDDFKKKYLDSGKYKRVVKWAGYGGDYVDKKSLKESMKRRIKESFSKDTLHVSHVRPDGTGVVIEAIGELRKELKATIDVGGITSRYVVNPGHLFVETWSDVKQSFAIFARSVYGPSDQTMIMDMKSRTTFPADMLVSAAEKGLEAHLVAYEGGEFTKMDIARLFDSAVGAFSTHRSSRLLNVELHLGWEKKSKDQSKEAASKLCEYAVSYLPKRVKIYNYADEVASGMSLKPATNCPVRKDVKTPFKVVFDNEYEAIYLSTDNHDQIVKRFGGTIPTFQQLANKYFLAPYTNVVIWLGSLTPYKDHDFKLPESIEARILNSNQLYPNSPDLSQKTIHFVVVKPDGIGQVGSVFAKLQTDGKLKDVIVCGLIFASDLSAEKFPNLMKWLNGLDTAIIFNPPVTDSDGGRTMQTFFSSIALASAERGIQTTVIAYEGGDYAVDDLRSLMTSYSMNRKAYRTLKVEFHTDWDRIKDYGSSASKMCKEAKSLFGRQFSAITRATEASKIKRIDLNMTLEFGEDGCPSKKYQNTWPAFMAEGSRKCKGCFVADSDTENATALSVNQHTCDLIHNRLGKAWDYREFKAVFYNSGKFKKVVQWMGFSADYAEDALLVRSLEQRIMADFAEDTIHIGSVTVMGIGAMMPLMNRLKKQKKVKNVLVGGIWALESIRAIPDIDTWPQQDYVAIGGVTAVKQLDLDRFDKVDWDWWSGHDFSIFYDQTNAAYDNHQGKTFHVELIRAAVKAGKEVHVIAYEGGHFTAADLKGVLTDAELKTKVKMVLHMGWQKEKPAQDGQGDAATKVCNEAKKTLDKRLTAVPIATEVPVALDDSWFDLKKKPKDREYAANGCSKDAEFKSDYDLPDLDKAACAKCFDGGNGKDESKPLEEKLESVKVDEKTKKETIIPAVPMKKGTYELLTEKLGRSYKYHAEFVPHFFENNAARGADKYERMVQWTGYSADYSESLLFYQALEKVIIREKFYENTIHVGPVTWMGIGAVNHILGRMRRETFLGTAKHKVKNIALGGLCSTLALEAIHADVWGLYAWTKQDFVMFFPKPKGVGDWDYTVAYNAAEYKLKTPIKNILGVMTDKQKGDSRTADVVIHAAGFGLESYHVAFEGGNQARDEFLNILERVKLVRATVSRVDPPADKKTMAEKDQLYLDDEKRRDNVVAKAKTDMHLGWQKTDPTDKSADSAVNSIAQSILELGFAAKSEAVTNDRDELIKNGLCKEVLGAPCGQVACYSKYNCQCSNKDDPKIPSATFYINNGEHTKRFRGEKPHMDDSVKYCIVQTRDAAGNRYEPFDMQTNQLLRKSAKLADMIWADHKADDAMFMTHLKEVSAKN